MIRSFLIISFLLCSFTGFAQTGDIIGSWIWKDSVNKIQLFIKKRGTIEQGSGLEFEDVWRRDTRRGTFTFDKGKLEITWLSFTDTNETWLVTFTDQGKAAYMQMPAADGKPGKKYLFKKIIDEEVMPEEK